MDWKEGSRCYAPYNDDDGEVRMYPASVIEVHKGQGDCYVLFEGYGNVETVLLSALEPYADEDSNTMTGTNLGKSTNHVKCWSFSHEPCPLCSVWTHHSMFWFWHLAAMIDVAPKYYICVCRPGTEEIQEEGEGYGVVQSRSSQNGSSIQEHPEDSYVQVDDGRSDDAVEGSGSRNTKQLEQTALQITVQSPEYLKFARFWLFALTNTTWYVDDVSSVLWLTQVYLWIFLFSHMCLRLSQLDDANGVDDDADNSDEWVRIKNLYKQYEPNICVERNI